MLCLPVIELQAVEVTRVEGRVLEAGTGKPLPFVHVLIDNRPVGTTTNMDGYFSLESQTPFDTLVFSYVGYERKKIAVDDWHHPGETKATGIRVFLVEAPFELDEVIFTPKENPALKIIQKTINNRSKFNPESNRSYEFDAYNKFYISNSLAMGEVDLPEPIDSLNRQTMEFLKNHHFFMMESVINSKYLRPGRTMESVKAMRASGFERPMFIELATAFQLMNFHEPDVSILGTQYRNPLAPDGLQKYYFDLKDTIPGNEDSTFVIRFEPKKDNFKAFSGVFYINSRDFALENVIAKTFNPLSDLSINIQQKYQKTEAGTWFPAEVKTLGKVDAFININIEVEIQEGEEGSYSPEGFIVYDTEVRNLEINTDLTRRDFTPYAFFVPDIAYERPDSFWLKYRNPLDSISVNTYSFIDSIGKEHNFDRHLHTAGAVISGYIPWKWFYFEIIEILTVNQYEKFRLGLPVKTNNQFSSIFFPEAYVAYGFGDKQWKYGGGLEFRLHNASDTRLKLSYQHDVEQIGQISHLRGGSATIVSQFLRNLIGIYAEDFTRYELRARSRFLQFANIHTFFAVEDRMPRPDFVYNDPGRDLSFQDYRITEAGLNIRYGFGEKLLRTGDFFHVEPGKYPVINFKYTRGFQGLFDGDFAFNRFNLIVQHNADWFSIGTTTMSINAGLLDRSLPPGKLFTGDGSLYRRFHIFLDNAYQTMDVNAFFYNRYISLNVEQELYSWVWNPRRSTPELSLWNKVGWSEIDNPERYEGLDVKAFPNGYFETGLNLKKLYHQLGAGAYYGYGPYAHDQWGDNLYFKLIFSYTLSGLLP